MDADLLLQHQRYLRRLVRGLAVDGHAADDLEQATWLAALEHPPRSRDAWRTWLARVARNLSFNRRRAEANEARRREGSVGKRYWPPVDEVAAELELAERVLAAVRALPEALRAAVHARYYEGLALEEIARRSGVPAATIKDRLERARSILRARLGRDLGGERWLLGALIALVRRVPSSLAGGMLVKKVVALVGLVLVAVLAFRLLGVRAEHAGAPPRTEALAAVSSEAEQAAAIGHVPPSAEREAIPSLRPAPVAAAATEVGSLLVTVTWPDGAPAEHVFVRVWPAEEGDLARFHRGAATDAEGTCAFDDLEPGPYRVQLEREKDSALADVRAGEEALLELAVSAGPRAKGLVVNEHGEPVAGAGVWISTRYWIHAPIDDSSAAITGSDGRFDIPSVGKAWLIGARAEGYAPSHEESLARFRLPEVEVRLVLPERGGAIEGRVLDPAGAPVGGASISADVGFRFEPYPQGGYVVLNSLHLRTCSSTDGSFRFSGVQPGEVELVVASAEHGGWRRKVEVTAGETTRVEALVQPGGTVAGRVLAPDGTPLAGVLVVASLASRAEPVQPDSQRMEQDWSRILRTSSNDYAAMRTRLDGSYRLTGLPAGWNYVVAQNDDAGRALESFRVEPGAEVRLELMLARGLELTCCIVDPAGRPLAELPVFVARTAGDQGTTYGSRGPFLTDAGGRIRVPNCQDALYQLDIRHARYDDHHLASPDDHGLRPGPVEHRIVVDYQDPPVASVRGIVLDDGGRPLGGARVDLEFPGGGSDHIADSAPDGSFHAKGLEPGTYGLWIRAPDFPYIGLPPREFRPGETLDLGTLHMKTPGFLEVVLRREDGERIDDERWHVDLYWPDGSYWWSNFEIELGVARSDPIEPGDYVLRVAGLADRPVLIEAGVTRELEVVWTAPK